MAEEINTTKAELTEEQKKYIHDQVDSFNERMKVDKVRIPAEVEEVSLRWVKHAPFLSEFLLRFNYFMTEQIPTMGVNSRRGRINLYMNPKFMRGGQFLPRMQWVDDKKNPLKEDKAGNPIDSNGKVLPKETVQQLPVFEKDSNGNIKLDPFGAPIIEQYESAPMTEEELEGVLVHEIEHLIRCHGERALEDHYIWNIAADMLINDDITTMSIGNRKLVLPKGAVYLAQATKDGYTGQKITEELYFWLLDKRNEYRNQMEDLIKQAGGGSGGEGGKCPHCDGSGKEKDDNGNETDQPCPHCAGTGKQPSGNGDELFDAIYGSKIDDHSVMEESDSLAEQAIKEIIDTAQIRGWGNMTGSGVTKLEELCKGAKINWKTLLRKYLSAAVSSPGNIYENNWSRRNRRGLPLPGIKKLSNKVVVGIDVSGSIGDHDIQVFFTEIEKIVKDVGQLTVIQWDTEIKDVWKEYKRGDYKKIKITGRGGTDVQKTYNWMKENKMDQYPLVMFTDGWFDYDFDTQHVKTVWCVTDESRCTVPGGKNIFVNIKDYHK